MEVKSKVDREMDGMLGAVGVLIYGGHLDGSASCKMPNEDKEVAWNVGDGVCDHVGDNRCILLGAMVVIEMMMGEEDDKVVKVVFKEFGKRKEHFL